MKKSLLKFTFIITLLSGFLVGCDKANFRFLNGKEGLWGDEDYRFDEDDYDDWWDDFDDDWFDDEDDDDDNHGGQSGNEVTFDDNSTKFGHSFSGTKAGKVAIYARADNCKDQNLVVPSIYVDSSGNRYEVQKDTGNGFNGLTSTITITIPDTFESIDAGFDNCLYLKTIYLPSSITKIEAEIIVSCIALQKIDYDGTKAEWNAIEKDDRWNFNAPAFTISCSDGMIEMQSWAESHPGN